MEQIAADISKLSRVLIQGDQVLFNNAESTLASALGRGDPLVDELKGVREAFVRALWKSREVAGRVEGTLRDFTGNFLDYLMSSDEDPSEMSNELGIYIRTVQGQQGANADIGVKQLVTKLTTVTTTLQGRYPDQLASIEREIKPSQDELVALQSKLVSLAKDANATLASALSAGVTSLLAIPCVDSSLIEITKETGHAKDSGLSKYLSETKLSAIVDTKRQFAAQLDHLSTLGVDSDLALVRARLEAAGWCLRLLQEAVELFAAAVQMVVDLCQEARQQAEQRKQMPAEIQVGGKVLEALSEAAKIYQTTVR